MCQENFNITDIASLIVAIAAFIVAYISLKETKSALKLTQESNLNQIRATVLSLLTERAKEANSLFPKPDFISPITVAQQQLDKILIENFKAKESDRDFYVDMFYLTLHTSIRMFLWEKPTTTYLQDDNYMKQIKDAQEFLRKSHEKWDNK